MPDKGNAIHPLLLEEMDPHQHIKDALVEIPGKTVVEAKRAYPLADELLAQGRKNAEGGAVEPTQGTRDPDHPTSPLGGVEYALNVAARGAESDLGLVTALGQTLHPDEFKFHPCPPIGIGWRRFTE